MLLFSRVELYEGYLLQGKARWPKCSDIVPEKIFQPPSPSAHRIFLTSLPFLMLSGFSKCYPTLSSEIPSHPRKKYRRKCMCKIFA